MQAVTDKPFSPAAKQNRDAILPILKTEFKHANKVLEVGSGTGQHAIYFARHMPHLSWQASDKEENITGIKCWIDEAGQNNVPAPIVLDVCKKWPDAQFDAAFAANVAHIMHWHEIKAMFAGLANALVANASFCLYGPFNVNGEYTSESNREFDQWLKNRDPQSCIRDKGELDELAKIYKFSLHQDWEMPCNNRILCWKKL